MNKAILIGRLCADPDIGTTASGKKYARYRLAVDRPGKQADGQQTADFLPCVAWEKGADFVERYLSKGTKIAVEGRIQTGSYEKDGQKHYTTDIVVERHEFCESKNSASPAPATATAYAPNPAWSQQPQPQQAAQEADFQLIESDEQLPF